MRTKIPVLLAAVIAAAACSRTREPEAAAPAIGTVSVTRWTSKTELFAEYPTLVVGQVSRFAIHLTRLDTFKALTEGRVEVLLTGGGAPDERFTVDAPSRPGIFGVDIKPLRAGTREVVISVRLPALEDAHRVAGVRVHPDVASALAASGAEDGGGDGISFLKEQQWTLDFATAVVGEAALRESLRVPAEIVARPGGAAAVVAPIDGRLVRAADVAPGTIVTRGQELARLLPAPESPAALPALRQAQTEAVAALDLATRDRERAERLVAAGAAPGKRLDEARAAEAQARARATGADARLAQYDAARSASDTGGSVFVIRSPVAGVVAERAAITTGANVAAGSVLFRVVDARDVQVTGQVSETDLPRARGAASAEIEVPGDPSRHAAGRLVSLGRVLDPATRTVPITFVFDNRRLGLAVGQAVALHLLAGEAPARPVLPASAIVDDAGRPVVYVQSEGETFARRPVTLGPRAGDLVQVVDGVTPGERVVTRGAYLVRLASLSTSAPAHGHVH